MKWVKGIQRMVVVQRLVVNAVFCMSRLNCEKSVLSVLHLFPPGIKKWLQKIFRLNVTASI